MGMDELYNEQYYRCRLGPNSLKKDAIIIRAIYNEFHPKSVADCGCHVGSDLYFFKQMGAEIKGLDASNYAIKHSLIDEIEQWNLEIKYPWRRKYTLCICFDTIEHIHPKYESVILNTLIDASDVVLISVPWRIGDFRHQNEQPSEYWVERFRELGYEFQLKLTDQLKKDMQDGRSWVVENLQVFTRNEN